MTGLKSRSDVTMSVVQFSGKDGEQEEEKEEEEEEDDDDEEEEQEE